MVYADGPRWTILLGLFYTLSVRPMTCLVALAQYTPEPPGPVLIRFAF